MTPILYLVVRSDLPDMNPGKLGAQTSHMTSDFHAWAYYNFDLYNNEINLWQENRNFGTVLTKSATYREMADIGILSTRFCGFTTDTSYPWRNWYKKLFLTSEITGGWFFANELMVETQIKALERLPLHE